ncbi:MAG: tyrosinase family protein [Pseudonocardiaceae bacterium]
MTNGIVLRPNVEQADIGALRDAYTKMQALSSDDNRSWRYWAGYHGFPGYYCWHHGRIGGGDTALPYNLFLPWHRAYLVYWDSVTRDQNDKAVLPWWDWTSPLSRQNGIPASYAQVEVDSRPNPLASGPTRNMPGDPARRTRRFPGPPVALPTVRRINQLLDLMQFEDFSGQFEDVHDSVHGWVDGDMGAITAAAYDPVFWIHHCMVDRLWYLWQLKHGISNIPQSYLGRTLEPFGYTVADVLDIRRLGYEYAAGSTAVIIGG